jgi:hypothetical protein
MMIYQRIRTFTNLLERTDTCYPEPLVTQLIRCNKDIVLHVCSNAGIKESFSNDSLCMERSKRPSHLENNRGGPPWTSRNPGRADTIQESFTTIQLSYCNDYRLLANPHTQVQLKQEVEGIHSIQKKASRSRRYQDSGL